MGLNQTAWTRVKAIRFASHPGQVCCPLLNGPGKSMQMNFNDQSLWIKISRCQNLWVEIRHVDCNWILKNQKLMETVRLSKSLDMATQQEGPLDWGAPPVASRKISHHQKAENSGQRSHHRHARRARLCSTGFVPPDVGNMISMSWHVNHVRIGSRRKSKFTQPLTNATECTHLNNRKIE